MNRDRRKALAKIVNQAGDLLEQLRAIQEAEEEARDNTPEGLQNTERYEQMEQAAEILGEAADNLEDIISELEEIA